VGTFFPVHILQASSGVYFVCVLHYLDDIAAAALATFRPVLTVDAAGYQKLNYQLTTMPARPALIWSLAGLAFGMASPYLIVPEAQLQLVKLFTSPAASVLDFGLFALDWTINGLFGYHTFNQLRLVSRIYTQHTNVNTFETGPLYVLSRVTAMTTVALLFISYLYTTYWSDPGVENPANAAVGMTFILIALVTFVLPLLGAHRLLQQEKAHRKSEAARGIETVTDELHRRVQAGDLQNMDSVKDALDSLVVEQGVLSKVSTWPWEPEALRVVVSALLLPIVLWGITRVLERFGF
jgi:hypothetical protein